jgi:hypothetical protein
VEIDRPADHLPDGQLLGPGPLFQFGQMVVEQV